MVSVSDSLPAAYVYADDDLTRPVEILLDDGDVHLLEVSNREIREFLLDRQALSDVLAHRDSVIEILTKQVSTLVALVDRLSKDLLQAKAN